MSHTAGPWKAYELSARSPFPAGVVVEVGTEEGNGSQLGTICELVAQGKEKYDPKETSANGYLIAAAPELLDALKNAHRYIFSEDGPDEVDRGELAMSIEQAIAKAEGHA